MSFLQKFINEIEKESGESPPTDRPCQEDIHTKKVRIAIYDSMRAVPRIIDLDGEDYTEFINLLSTKTYQFSQEKGGSVPFTIIKEIVENLIHAFFKEVVISIFEDGNKIRFSDQGPGIKDLDKALQPGFSTATADMKQYIKGVGSGLPLVNETLSFIGGDISIDTNIDEGTVITLSLNRDKPVDEPLEETAGSGDIRKSLVGPGFLSIFSDRQKRVLSLIAEIGTVGPSKIAEELDISLSTAHRDLTILEEHQLLKADEKGQRSLSLKGINFLNSFSF